jgi:NAD(P)-dependent dehydrogenase (short-subunit alcohol dehydrogenase family)
VHASVRTAGQAPGGTIEHVFDVTDETAIADAAGRIADLDGLVANAGIAVAGPLELLPVTELERQLDVNVLGQVRVLQAFLPALRRSRGRVVIVGSIGGRSALPFIGAYAMSKFALEAMADVLRLELAPWGITVALVEPGTIATRIWTKPQPAVEAFGPDAAALYGDRLARFRALAAARSARAAPANDVARAIEHALAAARPRTRYVVGRDARLRARIERLPDRLRDRVLTRFLFGEG